MQSVLSRVWTRVSMSISYDDNHYTTGKLIYGVMETDQFNTKHLIILEINKWEK